MNIPGSFVPVQQAASAFNNPVGVSSHLVQGAVLNQLLSIVCPVATVISAMVTEAQFLSSIGNPNPATWVLADGRDVSGSAYAAIVGSNNVINLSGQFIRGKNNGRSDGNQNPDGDLPIGTYSPDKFASHFHSLLTFSENTLASGTFNLIYETRFDNFVTHNTTSLTSAVGGNETAPKNITINHFIRIN